MAAANKPKLRVRYGEKEPPYDTKVLRGELQKFLDGKYEVKVSGRLKSYRLGSVKWGVYAFFDYEGEPIYVGQTRESLGTRIRRHLTNRRTDAVAMSVLDPFEVCYIEVWPAPYLKGVPKAQIGKRLDDLEFGVHKKALADSRFNAILNEKDPPRPSRRTSLRGSVRAKIASDLLEEQQSHPDIRIARRALVLARLAQIISERAVKPGLRRTLRVQAKRLAWLADKRFAVLVRQGLKVERGSEDQDD